MLWNMQARLRVEIQENSVGTNGIQKKCLATTRNARGASGLEGKRVQGKRVQGKRVDRWYMWCKARNEPLKVPSQRSLPLELFQLLFLLFPALIRTAFPLFTLKDKFSWRQAGFNGTRTGDGEDGRRWSRGNLFGKASIG